jgi:hypothetical protein
MFGDLIGFAKGQQEKKDYMSQEYKEINKRIGETTR